MVLEAWLKYYFALRNKKKYVKIIINTEKVEKFQVSSFKFMPIENWLSID
jgi:hypothetical protein